MWNDEFKKIATILILKKLKNIYKKNFDIEKIYEREKIEREKYIQKNGLKYVFGLKNFI